MTQPPHNINDSSYWWGPPDSNWDIDPVPIDTDSHHAATPLSKEAMKEREHRYFADQVDDLIPFWIRSVKAAEHGQVLRLADFLDSLEEEAARDIWPPRVPNPWRNPEAQSLVGGKHRSKHDWSPDRESWQGGWHSDTSSASVKRNPFSVQGVKKKTKKIQKSSKRNGHDFVEEIAVQDAVDDARKHEMHAFYDLPTSEKVQRIENLIRILRG
ncbi:hypothetical protein L218DRAFT_992732 [Marasmius fiardii PR-910]|nr:hypothetical protein L218DRAFT_992732 [Marasmius fiardii PR-910]